MNIIEKDQKLEEQKGEENEVSDAIFYIGKENIYSLLISLYTIARTVQRYSLSYFCEEVTSATSDHMY